MPAPENPLDPIVERTIVVTRTLRGIGHDLMERAFDARRDGELSLEELLVITERYQEIVNQANATLYELVRRLPPLGPHLVQIEAATSDLKAAFSRLTKVTTILNLVTKILAAVTSLALTVVRVDASSVAATTRSLVDATSAIIDHWRETRRP